MSTNEKPDVAKWVYDAIMALSEEDKENLRAKGASITDAIIFGAQKKEQNDTQE